ncbi:MAG: peptidylprolyl isomerase [Verrucomicrobiota bacterium]
MKRSTLFSFLVVCVLVLGVGSTTVVAQDEAAPTPAPAADAAAPAITPDTVIVTVDGKEITTGMVDRVFQGAFSRQISQLPPEQMAAAQQQAAQAIVGELVARALLSNAAATAELKASSEEIDEALEKIESQLPPGADIGQYLTAMGQTEGELRSDIADELAIQKLVEEKTAEVAEPGDEELKKFYDENSDQFEVPESVKARHILVSTEGVEGDEAKAEKKGQAEDIRKQAVEGKGENFADLAKELSEGPSGPNGGDLGEFGRGQMVPEFDSVVFSMEPGDISEVVETQFGYHVIKLDEKNEARTLEFDEVKDRLAAQMWDNAKADTIREYVEELRGKADIVPATPAPGGAPAVQ